MTGLDCLKEEMMRRGMTKQQCEAKLVAVVLDILTKADCNHEEEYQIKADIESLKQEHQKIQAQIERDRADWQNDVRLYGEKVKELDAYLQNFNMALENCETQEGRDRLKLAQMFINSVDVDTKYDNTAYIIGLAAILSRGEIAPIEELRKINKKIPGVKHIVRGDICLGVL